jgi:hypothetical protein
MPLCLGVIGAGNSISRLQLWYHSLRKCETLWVNLARGTGISHVESLLGPAARARSRSASRCLFQNLQILSPSASSRHLDFWLSCDSENAADVCF